VLPCAYKWVPRTLNNCKERRTEGEGWCITASTLSSLTVSQLGLDLSGGGGGGGSFYKIFGQKLAQFVFCTASSADTAMNTDSHITTYIPTYLSYMFRLHQAVS